MGRKRSNYVCERCGQIGFRRKDKPAVVHYDSKTGKTRTCSLHDYLRRQSGALMPTKIPPAEFHGKSALYDKLGDIAEHIEDIGHNVRKIRQSSYELKPSDKVASKCVKYLNAFEEHYLNPLDKLVRNESDDRWVKNWTAWFKTLLDILEHGPRAGRRMNPRETGQWFYKLGKDGKTVVEQRRVTDIKAIGREKELAILNMAIDVIKLNDFVNAMNEWTDNTEVEVPIRTPEQFYKEETARRQKK